MDELKIEYVPIDSLIPYANNAKLHPAEQIEQIKKSIEEFGFNDPIAIWKDNEVVEGHGRILAAKELGMTEVPVIRLYNLTDEQRRAYMIVHNKLTMNTAFDNEMLGVEIKSILDDFDFTDFGFGEFELAILTDDFEPDAYNKDEISDFIANGDVGLVKKRVIIVYDEIEEPKIAKSLGLETINKVVYDISELKL